ncbi:hypothetical protein [uncultured Enterovirga sp.]|uniref:hypothetical protein n=1 Tax=uncultured Enterovirga sp. TaxID=2026352 RepID=UPI0035CC69B7
MRSLRLLAAAACLVVTTSAFADALEGRFRVQGTDPGTGEKYSGTVAIEKTGQVTYRLVWQIGDTRYIGTGIGSPSGLAVSYKAGSETGIGIYSQEGDKFAGFWTYAGGKTVGQETWTAR